jgi:U3 small nucleolar RNA-associated protein MPP10
LTISFLAVNSEQGSSSHISGLLSSLSPSHAPKTRSQTRKRKRSLSPNLKPTFQTTPLTSLFVEGMSEDQVWEQLDIRNKNICQMLELILDGQEEDGELELSTERFEQTLEDGEDFDFDDFPDSDEDSLDQSDDDEEDTESESGDAEDVGAEDVVGLRNSSSSEDNDQDEIPPSVIDVTLKHNASLSKKRGERSQAQLDDGFFNLASFNAETERAEAKTSSSGHLGGEGDSDDDDISLDLFAPLDQVEQSHDQDNIEEGGEGREIRSLLKHSTDLLLRSVLL